MEEDEVMQVIHSIRQKMIQNKIVKKQNRGQYVFHNEEEGQEKKPSDLDDDNFDM